MRVGYMIYEATGQQDYVGVVDRVGMTYDELLRVVSKNSGNLAFKYGARKLFSDEVRYYTYSSDPDRVREEVDVLVLAEANLVNPGVNFAAPARFLEAVDKPVMLCGVGSQASRDVTSPEEFPDLPQGTMNYLEAAAARTPKVLVRGEFTKSVLGKSGISNVEALGCPSLLANKNADLWQQLTTKHSPQSVLERLAVTEGVYAASVRLELHDTVERYLFELVRHLGADYVGQHQTSVMQFGLGFPELVDRNRIGHLARYLAPRMPVDDFARLLAARSRAFGRLDQWIAYLSTRSAAIGTRIHGNLLALQAGIPALPVVHDLRTMELVETMGLPSATLEDVAALDLLDDVADLFAEKFFSVDAAALDERRRNIALSYRGVLEELGLTPSDHLLGLCA